MTNASAAPHCWPWALSNGPRTKSTGGWRYHARRCRRYLGVRLGNHGPEERSACRPAGELGHFRQRPAVAALRGQGGTLGALFLSALSTSDSLDDRGGNALPAIHGHRPERPGNVGGETLAAGESSQQPNSGEIRTTGTTRPRPCTTSPTPIGTPGTARCAGR